MNLNARWVAAGIVAVIVLISSGVGLMATLPGLNHEAYELVACQPMADSTTQIDGLYAGAGMHVYIEANETSVWLRAIPWGGPTKMNATYTDYGEDLWIGTVDFTTQSGTNKLLISERVVVIDDASEVMDVMYRINDCDGVDVWIVGKILKHTGFGNVIEYDGPSFT